MVFSFLLRIQLYDDISDSYIHILQTQWLALLLAWAFAATKSVTKLSEYLAPAIKSLISYLISNNDSNLDAFVNHSTWLRCNSFCTHIYIYIYIYTCAWWGWSPGPIHCFYLRNMVVLPYLILTLEGTENFL